MMSRQIAPTITLLVCKPVVKYRTHSAKTTTTSCAVPLVEIFGKNRDKIGTKKFEQRDKSRTKIGQNSTCDQHSKKVDLDIITFFSSFYVAALYD
jgi:hypothetical protein